MRKLYDSGKIIPLCLLLFAYLFLSTPSVYAQQPSSQKRTLTGTVVDESGLPVIGAAVLAGARGTTTDAKGQFTLNEVTVGSKITFTFMGYVPVEKVFGSESHMNVVMQEDVTAIDEVLVTGFGSIKKDAYAGSASSMKMEGYQDVPVGNVTDLLTGTVSGLQVSSLGGGPGSVNEMRIRGTGSHFGSKGPLVVIDGIPVSSGSAGFTFTSDSNESNFDIMSTINPNDIESMTVIKDAAAASLFGSRAANGVLLIVTKSGKKGKAKISIKQDVGFTDFAINYRPYLGGDERREFIYEAMQRKVLYDYDSSLRKAGYEQTEADAKRYADDNINKVAAKPWNGKWTDWKDELFRRGLAVNSEVSLSGATDKVKYYTSLSYSKQDGFSKIQGLERYTGRVNVDYEARNNLAVGAKVALSSTDQDYGYDNLGYYSPIYSVYHKLTASDYAYNEDGTFNRALQSNGYYNPVAAMKNDIRNRRIKRTTASMYAEYKIIQELKLRSTLSYDYISLMETDYGHPDGSSNKSDNGSSIKRMRNSGELVSSTNLNYVNTFAGKHSVDALVAYEVTAFDRDRLWGQSKNFLDPDAYEIANGSVTSGTSGYKEQYRLISYISRVNYDYMNKYYLSASFRIDGSSRFTSGNRWGTYWSASAGWRFSSERFMENIKHIIPDAKLRFSIGDNGNLPVNYYAGYQRVEYLKYNNQSSMIAGRPVSNKLKWESNLNINVGIDLNFINRINLTLDYYNRKTFDLLFDVPTSMTSGFSTKYENIGNFRNTGFEIEISSRNIVKKNFTWNTSFNLSTNKNKVLKIDGDQREMTHAHNHIMIVGKSYYNYYLVEFAGIDPANGKPVFYTNKPGDNGQMPNKRELYNDDGSLNTNVGTYNQADAAAIATGKSPTPKVSGGLSNSFRYRMFDLSFLFTYTLGGWSQDGAMTKSRNAGSGDGAINQIPSYYRKGWKQPGDKTSVEAWIYANSNKQMMNSNTARLHSTDHLRLKSLTFGITLPKEWLSKIGIEKARIYFSGSNLLTWAASDIYDPEVAEDGYMIYQTPQLKSLTFGVDITF